LALTIAVVVVKYVVSQKPGGFWYFGESHMKETASSSELLAEAQSAVDEAISVIDSGVDDLISTSYNRPCSGRRRLEQIVSLLPQKDFESLGQAEEYVLDHVRYALLLSDSGLAAIELSPTKSIAENCLDAWESLFSRGWVQISPKDPGSGHQYVAIRPNRQYLGGDA
jgi:hypothetical protein